MRTFLLKDGKPLIKWGLLPDNIMYHGKIPEGYDLAVNPHYPYIIIDVDRHGDKDGFVNIPTHLLSELDATFHYPTKNNGMHYWFEYSGDKSLSNKASNLGIDLRTGSKKFSKTEWTHGGYVKWHLRDTVSIMDVLDKINKTSIEMNIWIEGLFAYKSKE